MESSGKIVKKQPNSQDCFICGMDNDKGLQAQFYETDNREIVVLFQPDILHQSYPQRLHGGIAAAVLDEAIGRCIQIDDEETWGVTVELNVKYHKPLPYGEKLKGVGRIDKDSRLLANGSGEIYTPDGEIAVSAKAKYMKMTADRISDIKLEGDAWKVYSHPDDPDHL